MVNELPTDSTADERAFVALQVLEWAKAQEDIEQATARADTLEAAIFAPGRRFWHSWWQKNVEVVFYDPLDNTVKLSYLGDEGRPQTSWRAARHMMSFVTQEPHDE